MSSAAYQPVQGLGGISSPDDDDDDADDNDNNDEVFQDERSNSNPHRIEPLEMGFAYSGDDDDDDGDHHDVTRAAAALADLIVWPHLALVVTCWLVVPTLIGGIIMGYCLLGRIWVCLLFALHLTLALIKARCHLSELAQYSSANSSRNNTENRRRGARRQTTSAYRDDDNGIRSNADEGEPTPAETATTSAWEPSDASSDLEDDDDDDDDMHHHPQAVTTYFWLTSLPSLMDILLFGMVYPLINTAFRDFFIDFDGTVIVEWTYYYHGFQLASRLGWTVVICRCCIGGAILLTRFPSSTYYLTTSYYMVQQMPVLGTCLHFFHSKLWIRGCKACFSSPPKPLACWQGVTMAGTGGSTLFLAWAIYSLVVHIGPFEPDQPHDDPTMCDPLDMTECVLPFPSFYHLKEDTSTATGFRVHLKPESFPTLKGRIPIPVDFLNNLDGFSTMGPLLFYMDGMKESHEQYRILLQDDPSLSLKQGVTRLRGHQEIGLSITPLSTTLLVDVAAKELVPHSAEIDYLDPERPLVLVFPGQPLKHNTQYALAVINATDVDGNRLSPSPGMLDILDKRGPDDPTSRTHLFKKVLLAALEGATHKVSSNDQSESDGWGGPYGAFTRSHDPLALQLVFDFHTASKESQLGPGRKVRDETLRYITEQWKDNWENHVRVIRQVDGDCEDTSYPLARTIHGELDVPWFLAGFGPGFRDATLDLKAEGPNTIGKAKFVVHVPCSLKQAATGIVKKNNATSQDLRAVVEFGHGLFYNRAEAGSNFLIKMANRNGYIITAMDWRGMSNFDFPVIARTMLTDPSLFEAVRDNLIQGYANKFALQHFIHNGMLDMPWLSFPRPDLGGGNTLLQPIPQYQDGSTSATPGNVESMFYGISQGGILGAGYVAMSGPTKLISRGVLGVPGTPFSLILSRSLQFVGYDVALLLNFYNNRHVRIFLSLAQQCWDSVEGSGVLGQPLNEPVPRILMQAGLGDPIVPTLAAERLARGLGAHILPHAPRQPIYGIPMADPSDDQQAVLTEILYQKEYTSLPVGDELTAPDNDVHNCVRLEPVLQNQIEEFFNAGHIIDPCAAANGTACRRKRAKCFDHLS